MKSHGLFVSVLSLCLLGLAASKAGAEYSPLLQLTKMTGRVQVFKLSAPRNPGQTRVDKDLPYIFPGSMVEITSGQAAFESDNHVRIQGDAGAMFAFRLTPGDDETPRALRVDSIGPAVPLYVHVRGTILRLGTGGSVGILTAGDGEALVTVEGGRADLAQGSVLHAGEKLTFDPKGPAGLAKGDTLGLKVPALYGFSSPPIDMATMKVATYYDVSPNESRTVIEHASLAALPKAPEGIREDPAPALQAKLPDQAFETRPAAEDEDAFADLGPLRSAVADLPSMPPAFKIVPAAGVPLSGAESAQEDSQSRSGIPNRLLWGALFVLTALVVAWELWGRDRNTDDRG